MLRDEAVARIQRILGYRTDKTSEIIDALVDAQVNLEKEPIKPWFLLTEIASINTVAGDERVPVPSDFLLEYEDDALFKYDSAALPAYKWVPLRKDHLQVLRHDFSGSGAPRAYSLDGDYFRLFPTPDAIYTLKQIYYAEDASLTANIENGWLKNIPDLLIGIAGIKMAGPIRDASALKIFVDMERSSRTRLFQANEARQHTNHEYVMGGED